MYQATLACLLSACVTDARRSDTGRYFASEQSMTQGRTASEAAAKGLTVASDHSAQMTNAHGPVAFAQIQVQSNTTRGKTSFCPAMTGNNSICTGSPCDVRNLILITAVQAENLPSQMLDKVDPYVWFWVDNKKNVASTPEVTNNENPVYGWGCPFAYDGDLNFDGEVWDSDFAADDSVGEIASSGGIKMDEQFFQKEDYDGDGKFELALPIFKNGAKVQNKKTGKDSIVRFKFELLKGPGYEIRRIKKSRAKGRSSRSKSRPRARRH